MTSGISYTRDVFLWGISGVYLMAFASLYVQIPGLYGENGILPAKLVLQEKIDSIEKLLDGAPTLMKLTPHLGLNAQEGMDLLCLMGMLVSFLSLVFSVARDTVAYPILWMLYLSLYQVGQTFLWFQWDILLLEAGFLAILVAPLNLQLPKKWRMSPYHQHDSITLWLIRWLLFRLMFASGVVKLTSKCPTWWGLTALSVHFESQCIPTPLAWWWHQLPLWFLKLSCVATYMIEIPVPFLFFSPIRSMRIFAFYCQLILQVLIILTGNYNFFNLLTIILCFSLLDDEHFGYKTGRKSSWLGRMINFLASVLVYGFIGYQMLHQFSLKVNWSPSFSVSSSIAFSQPQFTAWLDWIVPLTMTLGAVSLSYEIVIAIVRSMMEKKALHWRLLSVAQCVLFGAISAGMLGISLVPHTVVSKPAQQYIPRAFFTYRSKLQPYHLTNSYGLFRRMTGVGGRPEVIVEGSDSLEGDWKEYEFMYKPGNLSRIPPVVAPHQPRLDWQMWFAALGSYQHNTWFVNMAYRLLQGQPEVIQLLHHNPFPEEPPKYIRATLYHYHFSQNNGQDWWVREKKNEYFPPVEKDNPSLVQYLKHAKIIPEEDTKGKQDQKKRQILPSFTQRFVTFVRMLVGQTDGFTFILSIVLASFIINIYSKYFW
ncbi:lipase maturation factor 2-like isoform X1 [Ylistrum balloti]|uniref:lipase maturation factor 2-like isoform X1 n=1 Tax=Ylistrum balloti TaxID=509963 RepID=UPI002905F6A3|nr:lipase maturation factor 2-like isoform X1 [Ylistrum balloti]